MAEPLPRSALESALVRWRTADIITDDQATAIRNLEASLASPLRADESRITPTTILIYLGVFLVVVASVVFVALGWDDMGDIEQMIWGTTAVLLPWAAAYVLRRSSQPLAEHGANVLLVLGALALMLFTYTLANLLGWWPQQPHGYEYTQAQLDREQQILLVGQLWCVAVTARFSLRYRSAWMLAVSGIVGLIAWTQILDLWWRTDETGEISPWKTAIYGTVLMGLGLVANHIGWRKHGFVLLLLGLIFTLFVYGIDDFDNPLGGSGLAFLAISMLAIVLSVYTEFRVFLIFGALGLYGWLSALVVKTFGGSRPVAFALILLGALIVVIGLAWQYWVGDWFRRRRHRAPSEEI